MRSMKFFAATAALALGLMGGAARADVILTTEWTPGPITPPTMGGSGTLGTASIVYTTDAIPPNAGTYIADASFAIGTGTAPTVTAFGGITSVTAGVLGAALPGPTSQSITSSLALINPILFFNFLDAGDAFDFTGLSFTVLSSTNISQVGSVITATGAAANTANDGFAIQLNGSYTSIGFTIAATSAGPESQGLGQTVAFTIGTFQTIPEPTTVVSGLMGAGLAAFIGRRRRTAR